MQTEADHISHVEKFELCPKNTEESLKDVINGGSIIIFLYQKVTFIATGKMD